MMINALQTLEPIETNAQISENRSNDAEKDDDLSEIAENNETGVLPESSFTNRQTSNPDTVEAGGKSETAAEQTPELDSAAETRRATINRQMPALNASNIDTRHPESVQGDDVLTTAEAAVNESMQSDGRGEKSTKRHSRRRRDVGSDTTPPAADDMVPTRTLPTEKQVTDPKSEQSTNVSRREGRRRHRPQQVPDQVGEINGHDMDSNRPDSRRREAGEAKPKSSSETKDVGTASAERSAPKNATTQVEPVYAVVSADRKSRRNEQKSSSSQPESAENPHVRRSHHGGGASVARATDAAHGEKAPQAPVPSRDQSAPLNAAADNGGRRPTDRPGGVKGHRRTPSLPVETMAAPPPPLNLPPTTNVQSATNPEEPLQRGRSASLSLRDRISMRFRKKGHRDQSPATTPDAGNDVANGDRGRQSTSSTTDVTQAADVRPRRSKSVSGHSDRHNPIANLKFLKKLPSLRKKKQDPAAASSSSPITEPPQQHVDDSTDGSPPLPPPASGDRASAAEEHPRSGRSTSASIRHTLTAPVRRLIRAVSGDRRSGRAAAEVDGDDNRTSGQQHSSRSPTESSSAPKTPINSKADATSHATRPDPTISADAQKAPSDGATFSRNDSARKPHTPRRKRPQADSADSSVATSTSAAGVAVSTAV
jgi:hypothetical protein